MLIVRLFHVEHSVAVATGAAFAVPLPWSPGGVGACELSWAARQAPLKDDEKGNYVWFSPLGAEQPWQGDSFSGCGIFR